MSKLRHLLWSIHVHAVNAQGDSEIALLLDRLQENLASAMGHDILKACHRDIVMSLAVHRAIFEYLNELADTCSLGLPAEPALDLGIYDFADPCRLVISMIDEHFASVVSDRETAHGAFLECARSYYDLAVVDQAITGRPVKERISFAAHICSKEISRAADILANPALFLSRKLKG